MTVLQFAPFSSLVQPAFWHELTSLKVDVLRLSDDSVPINASYALGKSIKDRETGKEIALGCNLTVGGGSLNKDSFQLPPHSVGASGILKNFNTIEDFKASDKAAFFNQLADEVWETAITKRNPSVLTKFLVITFADLKKYKFFYWFAFPAFVSKPAWEISDPGWTSADQAFSQGALKSIHQHLQANPTPFFLIKSDGDKAEVGALDKYQELFANVPTSSQTIGFHDPSGLPTNPGWPLRNLLAYLTALYPNIATLRVLCWRDAEVPSGNGPWKGRFGTVSLPSQIGKSATRPSAVGWEKNVQGKLGARLADLAPMMDPSRLADQAVDLNLKLMRWRILPSLDLDKVASTRCLLLGAGTLGCYVARVLMGWGVRNITFLDSARVSFSNPVRQPLFEFEDCLDGGKVKAVCAADRLKKVFPGVNAVGHELSIPMPGHPVPPASVENTKKSVETLEKLIDEHDAIFLLMDSRESRWLPTVIGASKGKIILNAALGFDTYLVMRHGARAKLTPTGHQRLGCYYCNDVVAPADSLTDRTLDQMCTVTRPGLASIAAASAVELLVSVVQHPEGLLASAPKPHTPPEDAAAQGGILGMIPHQLRGFLAQYRSVPIVGAAYDKCTGCSETVITAYETQGYGMLEKAFNETGYLEKLTGLDKLYEEATAVMENVDFGEGEGDEDDF